MGVLLVLRVGFLFHMHRPRFSNTTRPAKSCLATQTNKNSASGTQKQSPSSRKKGLACYRKLDSSFREKGFVGIDHSR